MLQEAFKNWYYKNWYFLPKFNFWTRIWAVGYAQIWDFSSSSYFSKILNLKLFDNWWGNSYTKFVILDIKCSFFFENKWVLYWNVLKFLSNMTKIVRKKTIGIHILPNISRNKDIHKMEYGQLIEHNMRNIFLEKSYKKCGGETILKPFSKNSKLNISLS